MHVPRERVAQLDLVVVDIQPYGHQRLQQIRLLLQLRPRQSQLPRLPRARSLSLARIQDARLAVRGAVAVALVAVAEDGPGVVDALASQALVVFRFASF